MTQAPCAAPKVESRAKKCPGAGLRARGVRARPTREARPVSDSRTAVTGIETTYAGTLFRSRLEAKWAAFMTALGWNWTYEPFDANGYIPDFVVSGERPILIEVKPSVGVKEMEGYVPRLERALKGHWDHDLLIVGVSPLLPSNHHYGVPTHAAGLMGERWGETDDEKTWSWDEACWQSCYHVNHLGLAVTHSAMSFVGRPCGYYDGSTHLEPVDGEILADAWAAAANVTRWTKKVK